MVWWGRQGGREAHLRGQVEAQVAVALDHVLNQQGDLVGQADLDRLRQGRGLAEVDQVLEGEGQGHGLAQLNLDVLLRLLDILVAAQSHGTVANVAGAGELDAVLARLDRNCRSGRALARPCCHTASDIACSNVRGSYQTRTWPADLCRFS